MLLRKTDNLFFWSGLSVFITIFAIMNYEKKNVQPFLQILFLKAHFFSQL